jgi:hypothetical protein
MPRSAGTLALALLVQATLAVFVPIQAQTPSPTSDPPQNAAEKGGEWLVAPIPINSPAIGAGLEWAVARVFPFSKSDEKSPSSAIGIGGVFTNNGTSAVAAGGRLYLKEDKYRVTAAAGTASVNLDIYGIGKVAGDNGAYVPLNTDGSGFIGEFLYGLGKGVFVGARGQYRNLSLSLDGEKMGSSEITGQPPDQIAGVVDQIREDLFRHQTVSIGPKFQWDTRDNVFYPKRGLLMDVGADLFAEGLGSKWNYQYYKAAFNKYNQLSEIRFWHFVVWVVLLPGTEYRFTICVCSER